MQTVIVKQCVLLVSFFYFINSTHAQVKSECFELKYLDFFGLDEIDANTTQDEELDELSTYDFSRDKAVSIKKTSFLIPFIVFRPKDFYPACATAHDTSLYRKLKQTYFNIRQVDRSVIDKKTVAEQLEFIRDDFYSQVTNDSLLSHMIFTLDDGPFFGIPAEIDHDTMSVNSYPVEFGVISILKDSGKIYFSVTNKKNERWTHIMTGLNDRYLTQLGFSGNDVKKTSLGYIIRMSAEGESLTMYLKENGEMRFYFHSW
jgi:hypothetical protein